MMFLEELPSFWSGFCSVKLFAIAWWNFCCLLHVLLVNVQIDAILSLCWRFANVVVNGLLRRLRGVQ